MDKLEFTADDFDALRVVLRGMLEERLVPEAEHRDLIINLIYAVKRSAAFHANAIVRDWLARQPTVVCRKDDGKWSCDEHPGFARADHRARLVCIEPLTEENNGTKSQRRKNRSLHKPW